MYELSKADFVVGIPEYTKCTLCPDSNTGTAGMYMDEAGVGRICDCRKNWKLLKSVEHKLKDSKVPPIYWNFWLALDYPNAETMLPEIFIFLKDYKKAISKGINLYFHGEKNTMKTSVASFIAKMFMYFGYTAKYLPYLEAYSYIETHRFSKAEENSMDFFNQDMFNSQLLIIDDLPDVLTKSDSFPDKMLIEILKHRVLNSKNNIYISRYQMSELNYIPAFKDVISSRTKEITFQISRKDKVVEDFFA